MKLPALPMTDASLLRRLRANDRAAFETVVAAHYEGVFQQLWHICGDRDAAADLTQETFVDAWGAIAAFEGRSSIRTWLYTLGVRVWYRNRRRLAARPAESSLGYILADALSDGTGLTPARSADRSATRALLDSALAELPRPYREAILLFYRDENKYREIAESQNIPIGTVKSRLNSALHQLRRRLAAHEEELL